MLVSLKIRNIALVDECEINFIKGLNVLSGETGAGKSVILESINFVLGQKADKSMIKHGETECSATCVFDVSNCPKTISALNDLDVEVDDQIVIKRVFNLNGKTSIKLNGETVTASMLRKVTSSLVDVHGQSDHFALLKDSEQLALIDELSPSALDTSKQKVALTIEKIKDIRKKLAELGGIGADKDKKLDYLSYSISEIENAELFEGEEEQLVSKRKKLQNAEKIITAISGAHSCLSGENGVSDLLALAYRQMSQISALGEDYQTLADGIDGVLSQVGDLSARLADNLDEEFDLAEADQVEHRLQVLSNLKSKYGNSYAEIMETLERLRAEFDFINESEQNRIVLQRTEQELFAELATYYAEITAIRKKTAESLSGKLTQRLKELAMKNATFSVDFESLGQNELHLNGADKVCFMFSANAGEPEKPLDKVISGGELSRLMLAIKAVTANKNGASCYIFDEIDAGISGVTATVVAQNFAMIARDRQIIAISHLPQIVAMSDASMLIQKIDDGVKTNTTVIELDNETKINEVVRLVGGSLSSQSAITHATEMIETSNNFKLNLK